MKTDPTPNTTQDSASDQRSAALLIVRWAVAIIWAIAIAFANLSLDISSPIVYFIEYAVLSVLLVNTLWQHLPLKISCVIAAICAGLFGFAFEGIVLIAFGQPTDAATSIASLAGALLGAAAGYPLIQKVDSIVSSLR